MLRQHLSYYFLLDDFFLAGFFLPQFLRQPLFAECFFMSLLYHNIRVIRVVEYKKRCNAQRFFVF